MALDCSSRGSRCFGNYTPDDFTEEGNHTEKHVFQFQEVFKSFLAHRLCFCIPTFSFSLSVFLFLSFPFLLGYIEHSKLKVYEVAGSKDDQPWPRDWNFCVKNVKKKNLLSSFCKPKTLSYKKKNPLALYFVMTWVVWLVGNRVFAIVYTRAMVIVLVFVILVVMVI